MNGVFYELTKVDLRTPLPEGFVVDDGYQIDRLLTANGCSYTYLATDLDTRWQVTLQEFCPIGSQRLRDGGLTPGAWQRSEWRAARTLFFENGQKICQLSHPGLLRAFQVFAANRSVYLVLEHLPYPSLEEMIGERGCLTESGAEEVTHQAIRALEVLHQNQLVHGDFQPRNLLVTNRGLVLSNFELLGQASGWPGLWQTTGYSDPEFLKTGLLTRKSDIYSLGATLYCCLGGQPPSGRERPPGQLTDLRDLRHEISLDVELTVSRALEFEPSHRPPTLAQFWQKTAVLEESDCLTKTQLVSLQMGLLVESWAQVALVLVWFFPIALLLYLPLWAFSRINFGGTGRTLKGGCVASAPFLLGCLAIPAFPVNWRSGVLLWSAGNMTLLIHLACVAPRLGQANLRSRIVGIALLRLACLALLASFPLLDEASVNAALACLFGVLTLWTAAWVFYCKLILLMRQGVTALRQP